MTQQPPISLFVPPPEAGYLSVNLCLRRFSVPFRPMFPEDMKAWDFFGDFLSLPR
jgi:hypothetical protein